MLCLITITQAQNAPPRRDPRVSAELRRMVAAYKKLGAFSVSSQDVKKIDVYQLRRRNSLGRFGLPGRVALRIEELNSQNVKQSVSIVRLMDGKNFIESQNGGPAQQQTLPAASVKGSDSRLQRFFAPSLGLESLASILESGALPLQESEPNTVTPRFQILPGGESLIEAHAQTWRSSGDLAASVFRFHIGKNGFLKRLEYSIGQAPGRLTGTAILSTPTPINAQTAFRWQEFAPRPK